MEVLGVDGRITLKQILDTGYEGQVAHDTI